MVARQGGMVTRRVVMVACQVDHGGLPSGTWQRVSPQENQIWVTNRLRVRLAPECFLYVSCLTFHVPSAFSSAPHPIHLLRQDLV